MVSGKKRGERRIHYFVLPRRIDAREVLELVRDAEKPLFHVTGPEHLVEFIKGLLKLLGVPARRMAAP